MTTKKNSYHLNTKATFDFVKYGKLAHDLYAQLVEEFGEHFHSASGSRYVVTDENILYRLADHWGKVASCTWDLRNKPANIGAAWNVHRKEMILAKVDLNKIIDRRKEVEYFMFDGTNLLTQRKSTYYFDTKKISTEEINKRFLVEGDLKKIIILE